MNVYSLRSECMIDADRLRKSMNRACIVSETSIATIQEGYPDQQIEIRTELSLNEVMDLIRAIPDGHVMLQTLEAVPLADNQLERNYERM